MNVLDAINNRFSVRAFLDKTVEIDLINSILKTASRAPSGTNTQPWEVAVVSGKMKKEIDAKLLACFDTGQAKSMDYSYYPEDLKENFKRRRAECGLAMFSTLKIERSDKDARIAQWRKNYTAFDAPVVIYCFIERYLQHGSYFDYGMFVNNIMLAAQEYGLGSCPQAALAEYPDVIRESLGYSDNKLLLCGIAIGYPDNNALINSYRTARDDVSSFAQFFTGE